VWDRKRKTDDVVNTPKHTVLSMVGLTSPVWTHSQWCQSDLFDLWVNAL
jgi:hypothetical protein